jgi:hypothetical protein
MRRSAGASFGLIGAAALALGCAGEGPAGPAAPDAAAEEPAHDAGRPPPVAPGVGGSAGVPAPDPPATGAPAADASADASAAPDAGAAEAAVPAPDTAAAEPFVCNLVIGIKATGEWFNAGFENVVENARWEVIPVHNGHVELWADPRNGLWSMAPSSPCAKNAGNPDRVLFVGTNYDYTTLDEWVPKLTAVVNNIKARYSNLRRIELQTYVRAPGNVPCPGNLSVKTYIKPAQDEAMDLVAKSFPGLVVVSPRFEVRSCSDYSMPPHFTAAAAAAAARTIGAYYASP